METLKQAVDKVIEIIHERDYLMTQVLGEPEEAFVVGMHSSFGRWIRNTWGLWDPESALSKHFAKMGITHADDMSGIIMTCAYREMYQREWRLKEQVDQYKKYWEEVDNKH